jgi:hypothetical protein
MSQKPENPPAFALSWTEQNAHGVEFPMVQPGMLLRDWFAGQAIIGLLEYATLTQPGNEITLAKLAYAQADAMLAERTKERP